MSGKTFMNVLESQRVYVIAEAGLNHNGSLKMARDLVDVAALAGADAIKFQKRTVDRLAVAEVMDAKDDRFPEFGTTYRQIRQHLEFDWEAYVELKAWSQSRGLDFLVTSFDEEATGFLQRLGVSAYKLASHSLTNLDLLRTMATLGKPVILSTGMAQWEEIDRAVAIFKEGGTPLALLHCVSAYPTPPAACNLSLISRLSQRYGVPVGYSGHEMGTLPTLTAVAMGARIIERHITLDTTLPGFDHKLSLPPDEFIRMVRDIRTMETMFGQGNKVVTDQEMITRRKYHVSMASARPLAAQSILTLEDITWRNPGTGIPPKEQGDYLGHRLKQDVPADILLQPDMFE